MSLAHSSLLVWFDQPPAPPNREDAMRDGLGSDRTHKLRVVVIDDESTIAETLVEILNGEGFEALSASDGDGALDLVQKFKPDVVVSDVVMPGASGVEIGIRIREIFPKCRVILFSGQSATVNLLKEAQKRGHEFEIVAKPIRPEALISLIRRRPS